LRQHTDFLINLLNEITDEETKNLEEYGKAQAQIDEAVQFFETEN